MLHTYKCRDGDSRRFNRFGHGITFKDVLTKLGRAKMVYKDKSQNNLEEDYLCKFNINNLEGTDFFLFVGINLRLESPILNARFRLTY